MASFQESLQFQKHYLEIRHSDPVLDHNKALAEAAVRITKQN